MQGKYTFENPFAKLLQQVQAQGTNIVSPTLPVDVSTFQPQETQTPTPITSNKVKVSLLMTKPEELRVNDKIKIYVAITSNDKTVQSYNITIKYDPKFLKFNSKAFLDTDYELTENVIVNETSNTIIVKGTAKETPVSLNKNLAYIEFLTIDEGSTLVQISTTNQDTEILNLQGINILEEATNITIGIEEKLPPTPVPSVTDFVTATPTKASTTPEPTKILPRSSLELTDFAQYAPIGAGVLILIVGIWLKRLMSSKDEY